MATMPTPAAQRAEPSTTAYAQFAAKLRAVGLVSDPWVETTPRFATEPTFLSAADYHQVCHAAEAMTEVHQELVGLVCDDPALLETYFALGPVGRALWEISTGQHPAAQWHGVARADIFLTESGPVFCELNADTPSGHAEAVTLSQVFREQPGVDPNSNFEQQMQALFKFTAARLGLALDQVSVGIVYPTELTEDLGLILLYQRWLLAWGAKVTLGSPFNLGPSNDERVSLLGQPCDIIVRHYKTDWWTEREPVWKSAVYTDTAPLTRPLAPLLRAQLAGRVAVLNPWGAIVPQNKRCLALMWEQKHRFSVRSQGFIERYLPVTHRMEAFDLDRLRTERASWVIKSDYGCEGEETLVGSFTSDAEWSAALNDALPNRWIVQRAFTPRLDDAGRNCNLGVYLIAGATSGMYGRLSVGPTNATALSTAIRVSEQA
jgi:glutathionylspermidine synthase